MTFEEFNKIGSTELFPASDLPDLAWGLFLAYIFYKLCFSKGHHATSIRNNFINTTRMVIKIIDCYVEILFCNTLVDRTEAIRHLLRSSPILTKKHKFHKSTSTLRCKQ